MALDKDLRTIRRACSNREVKSILVRAIKSGTRYKMTRKGVMLYGDHGGAVVVHMTVSEHRGSKNLIADLRRIGIRKEK